MSARPDYSVVIPTRDRRTLLPRAVESALAQRAAPEFEVVVVDDGSGDATAEWLEGLGDDRLRVVRRERSGGASVARNAGIAVSRGEIVAFLDDDDELEPTFLSVMHRHLQDATQDVGFAWCHARRMIEDVETPVALRQPADPLSSGTDCGLCVRADLLAELGGFDEALAAGVDLDLLIRLSQASGWLVVPRVLVIAHQHGGERVTDASLRKLWSYESILDKHARFFSSRRDAEISLRLKTARLGYRVGEPARARRQILRALSVRPGSWAIWKTFLAHESLPVRRVARSLRAGVT